ncbi:MAG TPA: class I SAM-dependent methyltransferase [Methylomirabilota bacterium]|jgi:SAM-dependent methyltransferase|nr:class I SAM-dependent methyltransferase [Methylomirabilota bacterium]
MTTHSNPSANDRLREEFNRWAAEGRGEGMEEEHLPITLPVLDRMTLAPDDNVLDIGCGAGWLARLLAERVPEGRVVGVDVSDEMIRRSRRRLAATENVMFVLGAADEIPWDANFFTKAISIESAYYWPNPPRGLREIARVLREGGSAWILINYYRDNPYCRQWSENFRIPVNFHSAEEWAAMFRGAGFTGIAHEFICDPTPAERFSSRWFHSLEELRAFRQFGALLVHGTKSTA